MGGGHDHAPRGAAHEGKLKIALGLTLTFLLIEVWVSIITGSLALLSDAAHMLTDVAALAIALVAIRIARRPADAQRTFGYYRFEILAAAGNAVLLFLVALYIFYEAVQRFREPIEVASGLMLVVAVAGLLINVISMRLLQGSQDESLNMRGAYLEVYSDLLGSVAVIVAALLIRLTGWQWIDPLLGVLISLWVLPRTWGLLNESINILLEGVPEGVNLATLHADLRAIPGVQAVHDLHVWAITSGQNSLTVHLVVASEDGADLDLVAAAQAVAATHGIEHASIQLEPQGMRARERAIHSAPPPG